MNSMIWHNLIRGWFNHSKLLHYFLELLCRIHGNNDMERNLWLSSNEWNNFSLQSSSIGMSHPCRVWYIRLSSVLPFSFQTWQSPLTACDEIHIVSIKALSKTILLTLIVSRLCSISQSSRRVSLFGSLNHVEATRPCAMVLEPTLRKLSPTAFTNCPSDFATSINWTIRWSTLTQTWAWHDCAVTLWRPS
jgi:hypothetical protein